MKSKTKPSSAAISIYLQRLLNIYFYEDQTPIKAIEHELIEMIFNLGDNALSGTKIAEELKKLSLSARKNPAESLAEISSIWLISKLSAYLVAPSYGTHRLFTDVAAEQAKHLITQIRSKSANFAELFCEPLTAKEILSVAFQNTIQECRTFLEDSGQLPKQIAISPLPKKILPKSRCVLL